MMIENLCLFLVLSLTGLSESTGIDLTHQNTLENATLTSALQRQESGERATKLVQDLESVDVMRRRRAKVQINILVNESVDSRDQIIQELIKLVGRSKEHLRLSSRAHYDGWKFSVLKLGELKAIESINVLITSLDGTDGEGGLSLDRYPAAKALVMIGSKSIAPLVIALSHNSSSVSRCAAFALAEIGGEETRQALERLLQTEQDKRVLANIRWVLGTIARRS
jgi:hypothetical protein